MGGWRTVNTQGDLVKWDMPKVIEGIYAGSEERTTDYGENVIHFVDVGGTKVGFFGTTQINDALKSITAGEQIRIEYTGKTRKTKRGFNVKEFIVQVYEPDEPVAAR